MSNLGDILASAREDKVLTDYTLACRGTLIPVHKVILCAHSPVFKAAIMGTAFVESDGIYTIDDIPLCIMNAMVEFLYEGNYDVPENNEVSSISVYPKDHLPFHEAMFALGDKYQISNLSNTARGNYAASCTRVHMYQQQRIVASLRRIYLPSPDHCLRGLLCDCAWPSVRVGMNTRATEVIALIGESTDFAKDFLRELLIGTKLVGRCYDCDEDCVADIVINGAMLSCEDCGSIDIEVSE